MYLGADKKNAEFDLFIKLICTQEIDSGWKPVGVTLGMRSRQRLNSAWITNRQQKLSDTERY